ncbi:unnamed protein product [Caenorhabditis angaria]|uniref:MATH domain-containing protein n=1 Tax=Caenorhabditis angaria TaxID=860376 RepID=A0A9P1I8G0_9PELO|nr:unnamed protein product [Caenorhabditis angaria]
MELAEAVFEKYGSQHIFHIPNIGLTVVKASKNKANRSIYSQPFFSHGYGYKMMAICAPYGDGAALREYFSVFVCLMKSDFDAILEWPFKCKITFTITSEDKKKKVSRCYDPSEHPEMLDLHERPTGLRNGAMGFQNFISLSELPDFTVSSDLFLEIRVALRAEHIQTAREIDSEKCQGIDI